MYFVRDVVQPIVAHVNLDLRWWLRSMELHCVVSAVGSRHCLGVVATKLIDLVMLDGRWGLSVRRL